MLVLLGFGVTVALVESRTSGKLGRVLARFQLRHSVLRILVGRSDHRVVVLGSPGGAYPGNAIIAPWRRKQLFPDRRITVKEIAVRHGSMNLVGRALVGVRCVTARRMAGHVRFGARTGGALVILAS